MRKRLQVRSLTPNEKQEIERLARSRTEASRLVERARIIQQANQGRSVAEIAARLKVSEMTVSPTALLLSAIVDCAVVLFATPWPLRCSAALRYAERLKPETV